MTMFKAEVLFKWVCFNEVSLYVKPVAHVEVVLQNVDGGHDS